MLVDRVGVPEEDGETHAGIYDVAFLMSMPNIAIAMGKDQMENEALFDFSEIYNHPLAIRYPREKQLKCHKRLLNQWLRTMNKKVKRLPLFLMVRLLTTY